MTMLNHHPKFTENR